MDDVLVNKFQALPALLKKTTELVESRLHVVASHSQEIGNIKELQLVVNSLTQASEQCISILSIDMKSSKPPVEQPIVSAYASKRKPKPLNFTINSAASDKPVKVTNEPSTEIFKATIARQEKLLEQKQKEISALRRQNTVVLWEKEKKKLLEATDEQSEQLREQLQQIKNENESLKDRYQQRISTLQEEKRVAELRLEVQKKYKPISGETHNSVDISGDEYRLRQLVYVIEKDMVNCEAELHTFQKSIAHIVLGIRHDVRAIFSEMCDVTKPQKHIAKKDSLACKLERLLKRIDKIQTSVCGGQANFGKLHLPEYYVYSDMTITPIQIRKLYVNYTKYRLNENSNRNQLPTVVEADDDPKTLIDCSLMPLNTSEIRADKPVDVQLQTDMLLYGEASNDTVPPSPLHVLDYCYSTGELNLTDVIKHFPFLSSGFIREQWKNFTKFDRNGDRQLDTLEVMQAISATFSQTFSAVQIKAAMCEADTDKSATIDFYEYLRIAEMIAKKQAPVIPKRVGTREVFFERSGSTLKMKPLILEMPVSSGLRQVEAFLGVQYASILSKDLRFMPPTNPNQMWPVGASRLAMRYNPVCSQKFPNPEKMKPNLPKEIYAHLLRLQNFTREQIEDCLYLNIFVPLAEYRNSSNLLPVVVFVHGEAYNYGTGNAYDLSVLSSFADVLAVTLNYRLGPLGFLSTGTRAAEGNYALIDIVAALQWIKANVAAFGGDPNAVTLMGHGYGAALVNLLLLSPITKDWQFFHRAIMMSGSATSSLAVANNPTHYTRQLALKLNCSYALQRKNPMQEILNCFMHRTDREVVDQNLSVPKYETAFGPVIDNRVIMRPVSDLLKDPTYRFLKVDLLIGLTGNEGYRFLDQYSVDNGLTDFDELRFIRTFVQNTFKYHRQKIFDILTVYYRDWNHAVTPKSRRDRLMELLGDSLYGAPTFQIANAHSGTDKSTYVYSFDMSESSSPSSFGTPKWAGSIHYEDLMHVLGAPLVDGTSPFPDNVPYTKLEKKYARTVMTFWSNFIKTGNPNQPWNLDPKGRFANLNWPKFNDITQNFLHIGNRPSVRSHYRGSRMALWLNLIPKIHKNDDPDPKQHRLKDAFNGSTFDEGTRSDDRRYFIPPPTPPISPPPFRTAKSAELPEESDLGKEDTKDKRRSSATTRRPVASSEDSDNHESPIRARETTKDLPKEQNKIETDKTVTEGGSLSLSVTIAVGCSLLFLNLLIFAAVYYHRDKVRQEKRAMRERERQTLVAKEIAREALETGDFTSLRVGGVLGSTTLDRPGFAGGSIAGGTHSRIYASSKLSTPSSSKRSVAAPVMNHVSSPHTHEMRHLLENHEEPHQVCAIHGPRRTGTESPRPLTRNRPDLGSPSVYNDEPMYNHTSSLQPPPSVMSNAVGHSRFPDVLDVDAEGRTSSV